MRVILSLLGFASVGMGVAGLFVPLWPSTVFFIIAVALFARSNPKAERWLLDHPKIGAGLRAWREERAISRSAKVAASIAIIISIGASICFVEILWLRVALATLAILLITFIGTRNEPSKSIIGRQSNDVA